MTPSQLAVFGRSSPHVLLLAVFALVLAARVLIGWAGLAASGMPTGYGEGGVVHAGLILARGGDPYGPAAPGSFVSANYPPLGYVFVALGSPFGAFTGLRLANVVALLVIAGLIGWRARAAPLLAVGLAASFLALAPVALWGAGNRVDPLAVALAAASIVVAGPSWRRAAVAGALAALALFAKPTAAAPIGVVLAYLAWRERETAWRFATSVVASGLVLLAVALLRFDARGLYEHLVVHNAFGYSAENPALLFVVAALAVGAFCALALAHGEPRMRAYVVGALLVVGLSGHEGATVNYLLDLCAASCLALAPRVPRLSLRSMALVTGQLAATLALTTIGPFAPPDLAANATRLAAAADLPKGGAYLAEDSGVLLAAGIEPVVDDIFVWAKLVELGVISDGITPRVRDRAFGAVIADVRLDALDDAPAYERARWPSPLVQAILDEYRLERARPGSYRYLPRSDR